MHRISTETLWMETMIFEDVTGTEYMEHVRQVAPKHNQHHDANRMPSQNHHPLVPIKRIIMPHFHNPHGFDVWTYDCDHVGTVVIDEIEPEFGTDGSGWGWGCGWGCRC